MAADSPYLFRPMTAADLPLIRRWLREAHVREWWGDPDEQFALVSGDLNEPAMDQFIVLMSSNDRPFGYLQCYRLTAWNTGFGPQPAGTRGIDQFIGEKDMIGRGHQHACASGLNRSRCGTCAPCALTKRQDLSVSG